MPGLLNLLVFLIVTGLICYLLWWLIDFIGLPEPFNKVIKVIIAVVAVIVLINALLGLIGQPFLRW
jgi:hypothetical protein